VTLTSRDAVFIFSPLAMANTKSAAKRARQTARRTLHNQRSLTAMKTHLRKVRAAIGAKDKAKATAAFRELSSVIDRSVKSGRLHRNAASRHKSRVGKALAALG
jgi:small subunit ribosomal protein S20